MTEIMPVPRNLILLSYQQGGWPGVFFIIIPYIKGANRVSPIISPVFPIQSFAPSYPRIDKTPMPAH